MDLVQSNETSRAAMQHALGRLTKASPSTRGSESTAQPNGSHGELAELTLRLCAVQLHTNGRVVAEETARIFVQARGRELLSLVSDIGLADACADVCAYYGTNCPPNLRHLCHILADESLRVRGARLAVSHPGILSKILRGLGPIAGAAWSQNGIDLLAFREALLDWIENHVQIASGPAGSHDQDTIVMIPSGSASGSSSASPVQGNDKPESGRPTALTLEWVRERGIDKVLNGPQQVIRLRGRTGPTGSWHPLDFPTSSPVP